MKPIQTISTSIQRERKRAGLSLSQLAKQSNIAKSTLSQLEGGSGNPSIETLWALAKTIGYPGQQTHRTAKTSCPAYTCWHWPKGNL